MKLEKLKSKSKIKLDRTLSAVHSSELKEICLGALKEGKNLDINASLVEGIDTLCCQVLLSTAQSFKAQDLGFEITNQSDVFKNTLEIIGLQKEFE